MTDDWRLTVELPREHEAHELARWLREARLKPGERERLGDRVIVS